MNVLRPLKAIRAACIDCSGSAKAVLWCTCDGVHSTRCELWPYRFGCWPRTFAEKHGVELVTPSAMPAADVNLDDFPQGVQAGAALLREMAGNPARRNRVCDKRPDSPQVDTLAVQP